MLPKITPQLDAVLMQAIAEQALEDGQIIEVLLEAGCSFQEIEAYFKREAN